MRAATLGSGIQKGIAACSGRINLQLAERLFPRRARIGTARCDSLGRRFGCPGHGHARRNIGENDRNGPWDIFVAPVMR